MLVAVNIGREKEMLKFLYFRLISELIITDSCD